MNESIKENTNFIFLPNIKTHFIIIIILVVNVDNQTICSIHNNVLVRHSKSTLVQGTF